MSSIEINDGVDVQTLMHLERNIGDNDEVRSFDDSKESNSSSNRCERNNKDVCEKDQENQNGTHYRNSNTAP